MKTFNRTYLPESITYNGKVYGKYANVKGPNSIRVLVLSRRLKGMTDLHGSPYKPSVHFLNPIEVDPRNEKREKIKALAIQQLEGSYQSMLRSIDKALNSGAIDIDAWDESNSKFILPNAIVMATLESEATAYNARGTRFEKQTKAEVKNLRNFI